MTRIAKQFIIAWYIYIGPTALVVLTSLSLEQVLEGLGDSSEVDAIPSGDAGAPSSVVAWDEFPVGIIRVSCSRNATGAHIANQG